MKKKFRIYRAGGKWAKGIQYGRMLVADLHEATCLNEHYVKWLVARLNGSKEEPPKRPNWK